jgi:hypothetical protein
MNITSIKIQLILISLIIFNDTNAGNFESFAKQLAETGATFADRNFITTDLEIENKGSNLIDKNGCGKLNFNITKIKHNSKDTLTIIISIGNTCTSGNTGMHTYLYENDFDRNMKRKFKILGTNATEVSNGNAISFRIEGSGFCHPIYRKNNKNNYEYICSEEEVADGCLKLLNVKPCTETSRKQ